MNKDPEHIQKVMAMVIDATQELVEAGLVEWDGPKVSPRGVGWLDQAKASGFTVTDEDRELAARVLAREYGTPRITPKGEAAAKAMAAERSRRETPD